MLRATIVDEISVSNVLGEGVLWDSQTQAFWWTDVEGQVLHRYFPDSTRLESWKTPHRLASFGLLQTDDRLVAAFDRGIALYDFETASTDWLTPESFVPEGHRLNDGRVDRDGNFCVGSMVEDAEASTEFAKLLKLGHDGKISVLLSGLQISNGLSWSPNGDRMYHADSPSGEITISEYSDSCSEVVSPSLFARMYPGEFPDGATVDSDGRLWAAQWGGSTVAVYSPSAERVAEIELPVSQPTCVAFGGPDLSLLMVTSARHGLSVEQLESEPGAGNVFLVQTNVQGLAEPRLVSDLL